MSRCKPIVTMAAIAVALAQGCEGPVVVTPVLQDPPVRVTSNYSFEHEGLVTVKVAKLREQERLDDVVAGAGKELEIFRRLTLWSRRQFEPGFPDPYPLSNGLDILADIRSGKTQGFCGQYSYLLADALKSFGFYDVRYVETWAGDGRSHFLVEAWSNQLARWVLLDPLHAALVVDLDGRPLSLWEVHAVHAGSSERGARRQWLAPETEVSRDDEAEYLQLFRLPAIGLRNNLSRENRPWSIEQRREQFLALRDDINRELLRRSREAAQEGEQDSHHHGPHHPENQAYSQH